MKNNYPKNKCECGKLKYRYAKRCAKCFYKLRKLRIGILAPNYIDGRSSKQHYCIDCKIKEISLTNFLYGKQRCKKCANLGEGNPRYGILEPIEQKINRLTKSYEKMKLKPNNSEKLLIKLFKKLHIDLKYVGNRKIILEGFNPDFININKKIIIELYGTY